MGDWRGVEVPGGLGFFFLEGCFVKIGVGEVASVCFFSRGEVEDGWSADGGVCIGTRG